MQGWGRRAEAWLSGLRTWQFVLAWDMPFVVCAVLGVLLGEWIRSRPVDPSAILGTASGTLIAATIFAFIARSRMQDKAKRGRPSP
jgi:hypothetical protein